MRIRQGRAFLDGSRGRAAKRLLSWLPGKTVCNTFCQPDFLRNWHNHIDNYGNFMPGYCGGISLGSWFDLDRRLEEGIDLKNRPVLNYLVNKKMQGLLKFVLDSGYQELNEGYVSNCHLCLDVRKYFVPF